MTEHVWEPTEGDQALSLGLDLAIKESDVINLDIMEKTLERMAAHADALQQALKGIGSISLAVNGGGGGGVTPGTGSSTQPAQTPAKGNRGGGGARGTGVYTGPSGSGGDSDSGGDEEEPTPRPPRQTRSPR